MNNKKLFPKSMRYLHDLTILLLLLVYISIYMTEFFPRGSYWREFTLNVHYLFGTLLIFIVIPRFILSIVKRKEIPAIEPELSKANILLMSTWHLAIYIWLIIMPISGLLLLNANTGSIDIFNFHFSGIISQNRELGKTLKDIHETLSGIGIFLIVGHIIPVLFHHYIIEDNTLVRMYKYVNKR